MHSLGPLRLCVGFVATMLIVSCSTQTADQAPGIPDVIGQGGGEPAKAVCDRTLQEGGFRAPSFDVPVGDNEIKIMAYNAENFFDTLHDADHADWTYLPKDSPLKAEHCHEMGSEFYVKECLELDWSEAVVKNKIEQLAKVVEAQGATPDLIGLEEVENANIVGQLAQRLGYQKLAITTGSDGRGINNALIYKEDKLEFLDKREVVVGGDLNKHTRNILGVYFKTKLKSASSKDVISYYVNHWPSQSNPTADRVLAANTVKKMIEEDRARFLAQGLELHPIAVGDFNTIAGEVPHPFDDVMLSEDWDQHLVSVNNAFDVMKINKDDALCGIVQNMPKGTYYYKKQVQSLDFMLVGQNLFDGKGIEVQLETFRIVAPRHSTSLVDQKVVISTGETETQKILIPKRFDQKSTTPGNVGASDHFPIVVRLKLQ